MLEWESTSSPADSPQTQKQLDRLPKVECEVCTPDIEPFYDISAEAVRVNKSLTKTASWAPLGGKIFNPGRVVILRNGVSGVGVPPTRGRARIGRLDWGTHWVKELR